MATSWNASFALRVPYCNKTLRLSRGDSVYSTDHNNFRTAVHVHDPTSITAYSVLNHNTMLMFPHRTCLCVCDPVISIRNDNTIH